MEGSDEVLQETRMFVVARHGSRSWVVDLPHGRPAVVGSRNDATVRVDAPDVAEHQATLLWDGDKVSLSGSIEGIFLNGKRLEGPTDLKAGDELAVGPVQLVLGLAGPLTTGGRRAFTHHEFRERLYEEVARAARGGRPTSLLMVQARPGEGGRVAAAALDSFRAGDVVGTYAHDELEFLLPDTPGDVARSVVERVLGEAGVQAAGGLAVAPDDADSPERLLGAARSALATAVASGQAMATPQPKPKTVVEPVVQDPATRQLVEQIEEVASEDGPVRFHGEHSGGKGVFARVLHGKSRRADGPFVTVRCASLQSPEAIEEACNDVMKAEGGTVVLDEIGELREDGQRRLAETLTRCLGEGGFPFRLVSTTHRALGGLVERGAFDRELHDLLGDRVIDVPPLRNRPEDIIPMAEKFAESFGAPSPVRMTPGALARLRSYPWPGNVLELRNAMERAVRLAGDGDILAEHLPAETLPFAPNEGRLREHVDSVERDAIIKALADSNHNQTHAARRLGVSRRALIYKMEKYGLKPPPGAGRKSA